MSRIDWPLAVVLAVVFVVMSVARWRYFMARATRRRNATSDLPDDGRRGGGDGSAPEGRDDAER